MNILENVLGVSSNTIGAVSENLNLEHGPLLIVDVLIVALLVYTTYRLIRGTRAVRILIGLFLIEALMIVARALDLQVLNWLLSKLFVVFLFAIPVIFQPELRRALGKIGERSLPQSYMRRAQATNVVEQVLAAVKALKSQKLGALIVIKGISGLDDFVETGTRLEAKVSAKLLEAIFQPSSPLHDGAVIIDGEMVVAAGCVYTSAVPDHGEEVNYGLRHRAAAGFSLESDATVIVLSEERGSISIARDGTLKQVSLAALERALKEPLGIERLQTARVRTRRRG